MKKIYITGSINMDLVIKTDIFPTNGMTVSGSGFITNPGGKGANQAVSIAKNGSNAYMVGCLGKEFGSELSNTLKKYNVNIDNVKMCSNVSSGVAVIILHDGDNRIILDQGANGLVTNDIVKEALKDAQTGDYFLTQLEIPFETVEESIKYAKAKGLITILNPAPAGKLNDSIFSSVDYFVPNQSECEFYTGIFPNTIEKANEAANILLNKGVKNVIITMGKIGAVAISNDKNIFVKAFVVDAIDTTAAGDTFVGVMTSSLSKGYSLERALKLANLASSITVTRLGAQQAIPTLEEVLKLEEKNDN